MEEEIEDIIVSIASHPTEAILATGSLTGDVCLQRYEVTADSNSFTQLWTKEHKAAVRGLKFSHDGLQLFSITKNRALCQWSVDAGKKVRCIRQAHSDTPYAMAVVNQHIVATGDESGVVKIWDWRSAKGSGAVMEFHENDDYITDLMPADSDGRVILATSGDSTLTALNLKKKKLEVKSEPMSAELLCLAKGGRNNKILCGTEDGHIEVFNPNEFGNIVERIDTKHKDTVDCICRISPHLIATGSQDGTIRVVHLEPNRSLGEIGDHNDGVQQILLSFDGNFLISCAMDGEVKFWPVDDIKQEIPVTNSGEKMKKVKLSQKKDDFFQDLL